MKLKHLVKPFRQAGVGLEIAEEPIIRGANDDIVQMDITRGFDGQRRYENIRIWEGHKDNRIQVVNIDPELRQLVLMVHEPRREFVIERKDWRTGKTVKIKQHTSEEKRHFLIGVDERQLFIATLPKGVSTVKKAHKALKTTELTLAEGQVPGKTVRQGEWFFIHPTKEEMKAIKEGVHKETLVVHKKEALPVQSGGNPHTADYLIRLPENVETLRLKHGFPAQCRRAIYVKGGVRHADHRTVTFGNWRRVIKNNEPTGRLNARGINWVD